MACLSYWKQTNKKDHMSLFRWGLHWSLPYHCDQIPERQLKGRCDHFRLGFLKGFHSSQRSCDNRNKEDDRSIWPRPRMTAIPGSNDKRPDQRQCKSPRLAPKYLFPPVRSCLLKAPQLPKRPEAQDSKHRPQGDTADANHKGILSLFRFHQCI